MKRMTSFTMIIALVLSMLVLTACGKSEFGLSENTEKKMTITAENADKDAFFMVGSLEVADGEQIAITSNLTKGSVRVEIIGMPAEQSIDQIPDLNVEWDEYYKYTYYSTYDIALGAEVVTGLYQLNDYNGNVIRDGHLLTPDENIGSGFQMTYYYGIQSEADRVYAVTGVKTGQYLYVYYSYATPVAVEGLQLDAWNSENEMAVFKITANGTAKFKLIYNGSSATQLREVILYKKDERGDVDVADANGNVLTYHYDDATSPATLTGIKKYADDKAKASALAEKSG